MSSAPDEAPLIPPKRSSGGSNSSGSSSGSYGASNGLSTPNNASNGTMDAFKIFKEASKFDFYHSTLNNKEVEKILRPHLQIKGSYLLRKSNRNPEALTFSVVHNANHIYHFNVFFAKGRFTVTDMLTFPTLRQLITHFETTEIPGDGTLGLFLQYPIPKASNTLPIPGKRNTPVSSPRLERKSPGLNHKSGSPKPTPPDSPPKIRKAAEPTSTFPTVVNNSRQQSAARADPADRPPLPVPRDPIYDSTQHKYGIYAVPDDPDRDRFYAIRDLCKKADDEIAKQAKKCTCGLYLFESKLVDDWMMHRDIENTATKGKIFFVNTRTNEATWALPDRIRKIMEETQPESWKRIKAVLHREMRESARTEAAEL